MKKSILLLVFIVSSILDTYAVPAYPYPIKYKQPDGTEITIQLKGDERVHWAETSDGYTLLSNGKDGWEYAITDANGDLKTSGVLAREVGKRTVNDLKILKGLSKNIRFSSKQVNTLKSVWEAKFGSDKLIGTGEFFKKKDDKTITNDGRRKVFTPNGTKKLIMILIEYTDVKFTKTRQNFVDLMNTQDYNLNGAQGSVRQYFYEMSYGQFTVQTDVAPNIYTANFDMAYYGAPNGSAHDIRANDLMKEAIEKADPDVDYTQYDNDNDGSIDGVYIIYAGYGEASGGGVNTIWPHAGGVTGTFDGKTASKYSCSNELNYNGASNPGTLTTIGVICHEFGHVCGAPDYYDTDYSTGGQFPGTEDWDLMCGGCYNGAISGSSPAHFNPFEKIRAGWLTPVTLTTATSITDMPDITAFPVVYKFNTSTENEYYLLENRQKTGFNTYCPGHGLIIYRYSKSYWDIAANRKAPQGFYPVCASATTSPTTSSTSSGYGSINTAGCPFPGTSSKTSFTDNTTPTAKSWAGNNTYKPITGITENTSAKTIRFDFMVGGTCTPPTTQASNLSGSDIQDNQVTLNLTRGNGDKVIILARRNSAVNTTPLKGTPFNANSSFGAGDLIDAGTYVVYDGTESSVTITDLLKNSSYYFSIFEYNSVGNCYLTPALTGSVTTTGCSSCIPTATTKGSWGITNVQFNTINNSSKSSEFAYNDYLEIFTSIIPGSTHTLSVKTYTYTNTGYTKAWIDWNNDCTFQASEEYDLGSSTNDATVTKSIIVPYNIKSGIITMRIRTRLSSSPTACGDISGSEAEDYTLKIVNACTPPTTQATNLTASDIQVEQMTLNWVRGNGEKVLVVAKLSSEADAYITNQELTANSEFGLGTQIGTGNYVVYNGTETNVTLTGLMPNTTYYFAVYEYNSADNCYLTPALMGSFATTSLGVSYCTPTITNKWWGFTNVKFNTIDNSSVYSQGYVENSSIFTTVTKGQSYNLSATTSYNGNQLFSKAWIDWNKNGTFETTEEYDLGTNNAAGLTSLSPLSITVPYNVTDGFTRMRLITKYSSYPTACGAISYGECEDYFIKIVKNVTTPTIQATNLAAPDIQKEQIALNWARGNGEKVLVVAKQGSVVDGLFTSVNFTANAEFGSGTQIGTGNYVVYDGTNNAVTITGLLPGTVYYFAVYEYNSTNNCYLTPALTGNFTTTPGATYCTPSVSTTTRGFTNVTFNTINKTSVSTQNYVNNSSIITNVIKDQSYTLSATIYASSSGTTKAWIDWNNDGTFDNTSEVYILGTSSSATLTQSITIPSTAAYGLIRMRLGTRYNNSTFDACNSATGTGEFEDYTLRVTSPSTTWNGSSWSVASPTSLYDVVIDGTYNDAGFACNNLTVNAGKQMTIASGTLAVGGNLTLKSDETNGTATFVNNGTINTSIKGNIEQYLTSPIRTWYMSSPVANAQPVDMNWIKYYDEAANNWLPLFDSRTASSTPYGTNSFVTGKGYSVTPNTGITNILFTGALNTGEKTIALTKVGSTTQAGFNAIGNPYPSYIDWKAMVIKNNAVLETGTMWYRTKIDATTYKYFTVDALGNVAPSGSTATAFIPPMQGFWVKTKTGGGTFYFEDNMRSHASATPNLLKAPAAKNSELSLLRLQVSNGTNVDEAVIYSYASAENGYDFYDSPKMMNNDVTIPEIYTTLNNQPIVINVMNSLPLDTEIGLAFVPGNATSFSLRASEISNLPSDVKVILKDYANNGLETDLTDGVTVYNFAPATTTVDRFSIIFRSSGATTAVNTYSKNGISVYSTQNGINVTVNSSLDENASVRVFNAVGQQLVNQRLTNRSTTINGNFNPGMYVVKVNNGTVGNSTQKIVIK